MVQPLRARTTQQLETAARCLLSSGSTMACARAHAHDARQLDPSGRSSRPRAENHRSRNLRTTQISMSTLLGDMEMGYATHRHTGGCGHSCTGGRSDRQIGTPPCDRKCYSRGGTLMHRLPDHRLDSVHRLEIHFTRFYTARKWDHLARSRPGLRPGHPTHVETALLTRLAQGSRTPSRDGFLYQLHRCCCQQSLEPSHEQHRSTNRRLHTLHACVCADRSGHLVAG